MKLNLDDPRLTAYALGELETAERAALETELKDSPEGREAVEEIRQAAGVLSRDLAVEPCPALLPQQREKIDTRLEPSNIVPFPRRSWVNTLGFAAIAASVMFVIAWQVWFGGSKPGVQQMARLDSIKQPVPPAPVTRVLTPTAPPTAPTVSSPGAPPKQPIPRSESNLKENPAVVTFSAPPAEAAKVEAPPAVKAPTTPSATPNTAAKIDTLKASPTSQVPSPQTASPTVGLAATADNRAGQRTLRDLDPANSASQNSSTSTTQDSLLYNRIQTVDQSQMSLTKNSVATAQDNLVPSTSAAPATPSQTDHLEGIYGDGSGGDQVTAVGGGGGRRGGRGGRGNAAGNASGFGGGGFSGGGGGQAAPVQMARRDVIITETKATTTTVYDGDPIRDNFSQWRYYRYPTPLPTGTASYPQYAENQFQPVMEHPLSTFSADVDAASYANVRRFLTAGQLPPHDAVRVEEMINYFTYHYATPKGEDPFAASIEVSGCPWDTEHRLVRIGLKGREIAPGKRPPSNFVFLIDVSGSMGTAERLPLIKQGLRQLVKKMGEGDRVAIVVYASEAGVKLASTPCTDKEKILEVIDSLTAGGSTNGGDGIQQAYRVAQENFIQGGVNRVLLCTDGDFNVGMTDQNQLVRMVQERAKSGVFLTTLGVGTDNYKDALMQKLADKGNGNYYYLDTLEEAQKVLLDQMSGTLVTIAKDVKIQVEFNPAQVTAYRLIGYEKRVMRNEDFNNDAKDAGEIGAGHTVTALYEVVPAGREFRNYTDGLKYQGTGDSAPQADHLIPAHNKELLTLKLRYKHPDGSQSRLLEFPITDSGASYGRASQDFKFAAAVASFAMLLKDSNNQGSANYATILELAQESKGADEGGYRSEFINLVKRAQGLQGYPNR